MSRLLLVVLAVALLGACDRGRESAAAPAPAPATATATATAPAPAPAPAPGPAPAAAAGPDLAPPEGVTERFVERVRELAPGARIEQQDRRHLTIDGNGVDLANMGEECRRSPADCDDVIARWARVATAADHDAPITRAQVRAVLLPSAHVDAERARARAEGRPDPFTARPLVGPLVEALVIDFPDTIGQLGEAARAELGDPGGDALHALALENMRAAFASELRTEPFGPAPNVRFVATGDSYENSRVLLHERWADVARTVSGDLLVTAPARDVVIYTGAASEGDVATLRWLAQLATVREPHPIAPAILRWTPERWELFHANDQPDPAIEATMRAAHAR